MAYALVFNGSGHVALSSTLSGGTTLGRLFRADLEISSYTTQLLFGRDTTSTDSTARINSATQVAIRIGGGSTRTVNLEADSIPLNTRLVLEAWKVAGPALEIRVNGVTKGTLAIGSVDVTTPMTINNIGIAVNATARFTGKMYELDLFGNTFLNASDPLATTWGSGTLTGLPTDGSQWFEYSTGGTTPITFTGTIPNQTFTNGDAVSVDLSTYFSGTQTPFSFANTGAALTGTGLSITSAGLLTGTATTGSVTGVIVTGTDADTNTASSNAFNVAVNAAESPPAGTVTIGTITVTETTATVPYTYSAADQTGFEYRLNGGTPVADAASPVDLTGLTAGTAYTIEVRAVNASGAGSWSAVGNFTTEAAATPTITLTDLVSIMDVPWASESGITCDVYNPSTGALVVRKTGLASTAGADVSFTDAALAFATTYDVVIRIGADRIGIARVTT